MDSGALTTSIRTVSQRPTAPLVTPSPPFGIDSSRAGTHYAHIAVILVSSLFRSWQTEALYMARRQTNRENGLGRMQSLGEELRGEGERA